jgi:hypothetical protein
MKLSEFKKIEEQRQQNKQQLDELSLSSFIGDFGSAAVKSMFSGKGLKHQMIQDIFLKDFYDDAYTSLDNAIKGQLVNPETKGTLSPTAVEQNPADVKPEQGQPGAKPTPTASTTPGAPTTPTAPTTTGAPAAKTSSTAGAVAANKSQQQTTQNINNYVKQTAQAINQATDKNQKIALTKELVNSMADRQGSLEWDNAVKGVEGIIKRAGTDPAFANQAVNNLRSGKTMSEAWRIYFANKLVEAVGLTWKDLGLSVLKEGKNYYIAETRYVKLNQLFESIMEVTTGGAGFGAAPAKTTATVGKAGSTPAPQNINLPKNATLNTPTVPAKQQQSQQSQPNGGPQSIGQYMLEWFDKYMSGVDWRKKEAMVLPMIQAIEDSYPSGYKNAIKTLARTAFALSKSLTTMPKGMEDELAKMKKPAEPNTGKPGSVKDVEGAIQNLAKTDPRAYNDLVSKLKPV